MTGLPRRLPKSGLEKLETVVEKFMPGNANGESQFVTPPAEGGESKRSHGSIVFFVETAPEAAEIGDFWVKPSDLA